MWTRFFCCLMFATKSSGSAPAMQPPARRAAPRPDDSMARAAGAGPRTRLRSVRDPAATEPAVPAVPPGAPAGRRRRMAVSTALFSLATGLSRVAGLAREVIAAFLFGIKGPSINAFTIAFYVPNLIRALVADAALGAAFVPIFNELLEKGERERAWRVASTVFWLAFAGLSVITAAFMVAAPQVMALFGYDGQTGVTLARILFPIVVLLGLNGIVVAILHAFEEFFVPAIAPVAWNAVIIGVLFAAAPIADTRD